MNKEKTSTFDSSHAIETQIRDLMIHNDDFNTFEFVIKTLIDVCGHEPEQAEQCTLIIHHKGKCSVKSGDYEILEPPYREILNRGITATID